MSSRYLTLTLLVLTGACQPAGQPDDRTGASAAPIIGGSPAPDDGAVVWLVSYPSDESSLSSCTASVIAPDVLLTAAHCVDPDEHPDHSYGVYFGADGSSYATISELIPQLADIASATMHPDYDPTPPFTADIALVTLAEPTTVAPLPIWVLPIPPPKSPLALLGSGPSLGARPMRPIMGRDGMVILPLKTTPSGVMSTRVLRKAEMRSPKTPRFGVAPIQP